MGTGNGNGNGHFRVLTGDEIEAVLIQAARYGLPETRARWRALLLVLLNYGLRISEALAVRWDEVDWDRREITFHVLKRWKRAKDGTRRRQDVQSTEPLYPVVETALLACRGAGSTGRIWPINRRSAWRAFDLMCRRAGVPHYRVHDLRHTRATQIAEVSRDPFLVRDMLRHASVATSNVYVHRVNFRERMLQVPTVG